MAYRLLTCPENGQLELIDFDEPPCGVLIRECSGWRACSGLCPRTCAARIDRRLRLVIEPELDESLG
jgi:hypothetical protein